MKEAMQIDYKKACSVIDKRKYQHPADIFVKNTFNSFHGTGLLLYSIEIHHKTRR